MKKTIILICAMLILMSVNPVQAKSHETTGEKIDINYDGTFTYPAETAFYISHGWWLAPKYEIKYPTGGYEFRLDIDGEYIEEDYIDRTKVIDEELGFLILTVWVFNFPDGMTGSHTFGGHWFMPCERALIDGIVTECQTLSAPIECLTYHVEITFATP